MMATYNQMSSTAEGMPSRFPVADCEHPSAGLMQNGMPRAAQPDLIGAFAQGRAAQRDLFRLRAVLLILRAPHGAKLQTMERVVLEFRGLGFRCSLRSLHRWRRRFLCDGLAGLARRRRSDFGFVRALGRRAVAALPTRPARAEAGQ